VTVAEWEDACRTAREKYWAALDANQAVHEPWRCPVAEAKFLEELDAATHRYREEFA
jgi:hypothetical protein